MYIKNKKTGIVNESKKYILRQ